MIQVWPSSCNADPTCFVEGSATLSSRMWNAWSVATDYDPVRPSQDRDSQGQICVKIWRKPYTKKASKHHFNIILRPKGDSLRFDDKFKFGCLASCWTTARTSRSPCQQVIYRFQRNPSLSGYDWYRKGFFQNSSWNLYRNFLHEHSRLTTGPTMSSWPLSAIPLNVGLAEGRNLLLS